MENQSCQIQIICCRQWDGSSVAYFLTSLRILWFWKFEFRTMEQFWERFGNSTSPRCTNHGQLPGEVQCYLSCMYLVDSEFISTFISNIQNVSQLSSKIILVAKVKWQRFKELLSATIWILCAFKLSSHVVNNRTTRIDLNDTEMFSKDCKPILQCYKGSEDTHGVLVHIANRDN